MMLFASSCQKDGSDAFYAPEELLGDWIYLDDDNTDDYYFCSMLSFNKDGYYQIRQQEYNEISGSLGSYDYNQDNKTITFVPLEDSDYIMLNGVSVKTLKVKSLSDSEFIVFALDETFSYHKTDDGVFPIHTWQGGIKEDLNPEGVIPSNEYVGVDMGLSVNWAEYNIGAKDDWEIGGNYGWGDHTGKLYSTDVDRYPSTVENISGTEYDIASKKWGNGWRIPTRQEIQELLDNSDIQWVAYRQAWLFQSKLNGNSIYLPFAAPRCGLYFDEESPECGYWTSSLNMEKKLAYALTLMDESKTVRLVNRKYGLSVRPVKNK